MIKKIKIVFERESPIFKLKVKFCFFKKKFDYVEKSQYA